MAPASTDPVRNLAWLAKHHFRKLWWASFALCASPGLWLLAEWGTASLGVNPLNRLLHFSGSAALVMLLVSLTVTPARRLSVRIAQQLQARYGKRVSDWNWLIRLRRQFGLFCFFYACVHAAIYLVLDAALDPAALASDLRERPFIALGLAAWVLLLPLAATSNQAAMRLLGRAWRRLHMLSYAIAILSTLHFWLQMKVGQSAPLPYTLALTLLLGARVWAWRWGERGHGVEVMERGHAASRAPNEATSCAPPGPAVRV